MSIVNYDNLFKQCVKDGRLEILKGLFNIYIETSNSYDGFISYYSKLNLSEDELITVREWFNSIEVEDTTVNELKIVYIDNLLKTIKENLHKDLYKFNNKSDLSIDFYKDLISNLIYDLSLYCRYYILKGVDASDYLYKDLSLYDDKLEFLIQIKDLGVNVLDSDCLRYMISFTYGVSVEEFYSISVFSIDFLVEVLDTLVKEATRVLVIINNALSED